MLEKLCHDIAVEFVNNGCSLLMNENANFRCLLSFGSARVSFFFQLWIKKNKEKITTVALVQIQT